MKRELGIARCGLACCLCSENVTCKGCKQDGFVDLSWCKDANWCENRRCCLDKGINGCYECNNSNCRKGLFKDKIKPLAFCEFIRRYSKEELLNCLEENERKGIVYHHEGIMGDYDDFDDIEKVIEFIKAGKNNMEEIWNKLYEAAKSVQKQVKISDYVTAGEVAAAIESKSGKIYTGVCVDTASTLGICAERNAMFNMITNGEYKVKRVLAILPDGKTGAPCGACREFMVQLMADDYKNVEIMLDYETGKTIKLGDITPNWWI